MMIYQHDSAGEFRFVLRGELQGKAVQELEWAWETAKSILGSKELHIDLSDVPDADESGSELLSRMRESGARLTAVLPPASARLARHLSKPMAVPQERRGFRERTPEPDKLSQSLFLEDL